MGKTFSTKGRATNAKALQEKTQKEAAVVSTRIWSDEQRAIFDWCSGGTGNLVVRARAGTGKTTTIVESLSHLDGGILLCAFNTRIKEELDRKAGGKAHVYTLHGLGFRFVRKGWPGVAVDDKRGMRLAERALAYVGKPSTRDWMVAVDRLSSMVKECAPLDFNESVLAVLNRSYGCDETLPRNYDQDKFLAASMKHLALSAEKDGTINFSDMLYIPLVHKMIYPCYDVVIVDEAQDMNKAQLEIAMRVTRKTGRTMIVGDDRQAIYGFRGADSGSIDRLKKYLKAEELGLKTTYRCPKAIVNAAKKIVKDYTHAPEAPDGIVRRLPLSRLAAEANHGDFILARTNAPLLSAVLELVRSGKRAKIEGRDIGKGLQGIILRLHARDPEELITLVYDWANHAINRAGGDEKRIQQIQDQAELIRVIAEDQSVRSVQDVHNKIDSLFTDDDDRDGRVVCSTVHKAKGLEADRVFLLTETFKLNAATGEESNINYVAITRAKKELIWVGEAGGKREDDGMNPRQEEGHDEYGKPL